MRAFPICPLVFGLVLCAGGCGPGPPAASSGAPVAVEPVAPYEDWYPDDITPPAGTRYPCALTALPRELPGIPPADRRFINHVYSMILRSTQAKLVLLKRLHERSGIETAAARYRDAVGDAVERIAAEPVPAGLAPFRDDVRRALELQLGFFERAAALRARGESMETVYGLAEGRQASGHLHAAWAKMRQRYPAWTREVRKSIYHHLCALDLF